MNAAWRGVLLSGLLAVGASPGLAATFKIDPARSSLVLQIFRDGIAARLGHDHVVEARRFAGTITYDPRNPDASAIDVTVEAGSLVADDPETRRRFRVAGTPSASDLADIDKAMRSERQLAVERFTSMTFRSSAIAKQADGEYLVTGRLTIRGRTNEVSFPARVRLEGEVLRGGARLTFKQSSFGYAPYRAVLGAIKNKDEVVLHIDLVATP